MYRRDFLKYSAALSALSVFPFWSRTALAADRPTLAIPTLLAPDTNNSIRLTIQSGKTVFGSQPATTWGYNGNLLGPALQLSRDKPVTIDIHNNLAEQTTVHWHGLEVPGEVDGGPMGVIAAGGVRTVSFTPQQRAATCWFHPHPHGKTGHHVAMGLAGLVLIEDDESQSLMLPKQWGIDDIPLIIQDKRFTPEGQIDYKLDIMSAAVGWFGDTLLCNGQPYPQHNNPRGWLRLRLLNGCNARSLCVAASDNRPLYVIASDGGLLAEPVKVTELPILMGERFEVLVDTRDGKAFDIITLPVKQVGMTVAPFDKPQPVIRIQPLTLMASGELPDKLVDVPALPTLEGLTTRFLPLTMDPMLDMMGMQALINQYGEHAMAGISMAGHGAMEGMSHGSMAGMNHDNMSGMSPKMSGDFDFHHANKIAGKSFDIENPLFAASLGKYEHWTISGENDVMLHPFHIHGTQFRILSENGQPVAPHRQGWKDTVRIDGGRSEVLVRFDHPASKEHAFMAHCHLLEHEDTGMMLGFTVA